MKKQTTEQTVREIISEHLGVDIATAVLSARLIEDLGADSLEAVEIVISLEDEFDTVIPDNKLETFITVGDIVNYINENVTNG